MAKSAPVLKALLGTKVLFAGKFGYGEQERLQAMAEAQQGVIAGDLDASVTHVVLPDLSQGKTVQKKLAALNAKGASIQTLEAADFEKLVTPGDDAILALLKAGGSAGDQFNKAFVRNVYRSLNAPSAHVISGENFDGVDLARFTLATIAFHGCSFVGATLPGDAIGECLDCDFTGAKAVRLHLQSVERSKFVNAQLDDCNFGGSIDGCDFSGATLSNVTFYYGYGLYSRQPQKKQAMTAYFRVATLKHCVFHDSTLADADFSNTDAPASTFSGSFKGCRFNHAKLTGSALVDADLTGCDFSHADLQDANLAGAQLAGATFDQANLAKVNLRGVDTAKLNLAAARNYDPASAATGGVGPALTELDRVVAGAKRVQLSYKLARDGEADLHVGADSAGLQWGWGLTLPSTRAHPGRRQGKRLMSEALLEAARQTGQHLVRFETVEVSTTKSAATNKVVRELVIQGLAEAYAQTPPDEAKLAELTKAYREEVREQGAADRERREAAKKAAEKQKATEKKKIAKKIEKEVGKVTDFMTFLKALELRIEKPKIDKATKMLKASKFKLFSDIAEQHLAGVVKSQTDPDLVYACRIQSDGHYACCTQKLNICGGLRGSICKHLLVLIIGLVTAGELDAATIDGWIAKTHDAKPELDKEVMGEIFIRYKGAEAGEVDWRPTETVPEDYYAV